MQLFRGVIGCCHITLQGSIPGGAGLLACSWPLGQLSKNNNYYYYNNAIISTKKALEHIYNWQLPLKRKKKWLIISHLWNIFILQKAPFWNSFKLVISLLSVGAGPNLDPYLKNFEIFRSRMDEPNLNSRMYIPIIHPIMSTVKWVIARVICCSAGRGTCSMRGCVSSTSLWK